MLTMGPIAVLIGAFALLVFAAGSAGEGEHRAARIALWMGLATAAVGATGLLWSPAAAILTWIVAASAATTFLAWWLPVGRQSPGGRTTRRVDERRIMFARGRLRLGSKEYDAYYALHPGDRAGDDRTRVLPGLLSAEAEFADPVEFEAAEAAFEVTETLRERVDGPVADPVATEPDVGWTATVTQLARRWGAVDVGVCALRPEHIYTHIGRGAGTWGEPIELDHRWAIAFTVEMDHDAVAFAPSAPIVAESARQYVTSAVIGIQLAAAIRRWGYPARAHIDGNYRVVAPLVARDAGLGEIGRMGLVMTPGLGPRVRLGIVTTDLALAPSDDGQDPSVLDFCTVCRKCAEACPVGAIPHDDRTPVEGGALRWEIDSERCFRYWWVAGTDCGTCMRVCPYSHPDTMIHAPVRWAIRRSGTARRALLAADDLFYGRTPAARAGTRIS